MRNRRSDAMISARLAPDGQKEDANYSKAASHLREVARSSFQRLFIEKRGGDSVRRLYSFHDTWWGVLIVHSRCRGAAALWTIWHGRPVRVPA